MDDDRTPTSGTRRHRQRSSGTGLVLAVVLVAVGLLAAACGGGTKDPGAASAASSRTSTSTTAAPSVSSGANSSGQSSQAEQLKFSQCMRSEGVSNFPDPPANGAFLHALSAAGIDTHSPIFQSALQACKKFNPAGNLTPAQSAAQNAKGLQFAQCMRSHGVANFPEPSQGSNGQITINGGTGSGIDPNSPQFQSAQQACSADLPTGAPSAGGAG